MFQVGDVVRRKNNIASHPAKHGLFEPGTMEVVIESRIGAYVPSNMFDVRPFAAPDRVLTWSAENMEKVDV